MSVPAAEVRAEPGMTQHGPALADRFAPAQASPGANDELVDFDTLAGKDTKQPATETKPAEAPAQPAVPDKFKGKTVDQVVDMYRELETAYGRQGNELGQQRKLTDQLLELRKEPAPAQPKTEPRKPLDVSTLLDNPEEAIRQAVDTHPDVVAARKLGQTNRVLEAHAALSKSHPDYQTVMSDPAFVEWITANPSQRDILAIGDQTFNTGIVGTVLDAYKATHKTSAGPTAEETAAARRTATVETRSTGTPVGAEKRQVYRRADLLKLRMQDPDRYDSMYPEIAKAYQEGRVI